MMTGCRLIDTRNPSFLLSDNQCILGYELFTLSNKKSEEQDSNMELQLTFINKSFKLPCYIIFYHS